MVLIAQTTISTVNSGGHNTASPRTTARRKGRGAACPRPDRPGTSLLMPGIVPISAAAVKPRPVARPGRACAHCSRASRACDRSPSALLATSSAHARLRAGDHRHGHHRRPSLLEHLGRLATGGAGGQHVVDQQDAGASDGGRAGGPGTPPARSRIAAMGLSWLAATCCGTGPRRLRRTGTPSDRPRQPASTSGLFFPRPSRRRQNIGMGTITSARTSARCPPRRSARSRPRADESGSCAGRFIRRTASRSPA